MLLEQEKKKYSRFLEKLAESVDLTEEQYLFAKKNYEELGTFLEEPNTLLSDYEPHILPQGSIKLGTCVKPVVEDEEFDVDMTCKLHCHYPQQQYALKQLLYRRLNESPKYQKMLDDEKQRCWRLSFPDKFRFHLDLVPAFQDEYQWLINLGVPSEHAKHAICITDNENKLYNQNVDSTMWPKSNTEGYAQWFLDVMKVQADQIKTNLMQKLLLEKIEDVPEYKVRTPLQQGIQLMKRHRDITFKGKDDKPISIIITTLAARAYDKVMKKPKSLMFYDILIEIIDEMPSFIKKTGGEWIIENPVDPMENFADKWNENSQKAKDFQDWHSKLKEDFKQSYLKEDIQAAINFLKPKYGNNPVNEAINGITGKSVLLSESKTAIDFSHKQLPVWDMKLNYNIGISCRYKESGEWNWADFQNESLPAKCSLIFKAKTNVPAPYSVYWQVVNTGEEAKNANDLRGSIFNASAAGIGGLIQKENTKYKGQHWLECFIIKDDVCVARSGEYIINVI